MLRCPFRFRTRRRDSLAASRSRMVSMRTPSASAASSSASKYPKRFQTSALVGSRVMASTRQSFLVYTDRPTRTPLVVANVFTAAWDEEAAVGVGVVPMLSVDRSISLRLRIADISAASAAASPLSHPSLRESASTATPPPEAAIKSERCVFRIAIFCCSSRDRISGDSHSPPSAAAANGSLLLDCGVETLAPFTFTTHVPAADASASLPLPNGASPPLLVVGVLCS